MMDKEFLKIYNQIFETKMQYVDFLIIKNNLTFECVDFICKHLHFMMKRIQESYKQTQFIMEFPKILEIKELKKQLESETDQAKKDEIMAKINDYKSLFDVNKSENYIYIKNQLKKFIILREELKAIKQIESNLEEIKEKTNWQETLEPLKNNKKMSVTEASFFARKIVNTYFSQKGLEVKPKLTIAQSDNTDLFNLSGDSHPLQIDENCLRNLNTKAEKRKFAKQVLVKCATAYTQVVLTNTKLYKNHAEAGMLGVLKIDEKLLKLQEQEVFEEFVNNEVERVFKPKTPKMIVLPMCKIEELLFNEYLGSLAITNKQKNLKKAPK